MERISRHTMLSTLWERRPGWAVFGGLFLLYGLTGRGLHTGDLTATLLLPVAWIQHGRLCMNPYIDALYPQIGFLTFAEDGCHLAFHSPWLSLFFAPAMALSLLWHGGVTPEALHWPQQISAHVIMAVGGALLWTLLDREYGRRAAWLGAAGFALGSANWFTLSQVAFPNTIAQVLALAGLHQLVRERPTLRHGLLGLLSLAMATIVRPTLFLGLFIGCALGMRSRLSLASPLIGCGMLYAMTRVNVALTGSYMAGYTTRDADLQFIRDSFHEALYGNLLGPARGLVVFSPWVVFAVASFLITRRWRWLHLAGLAAFGGHLFLLGNHFHWWGGTSYGPRLNMDYLPFLAMAAGPVMDAASRLRLGRWLVGVALAWSIAIGGVHALYRDTGWVHRPGPPDRIPARLNDWRDPYIFAPLLPSAWNHESRYEIALIGPHPNLTLARPGECLFTWQALPGSDHYKVEFLTELEWGYSQGRYSAAVKEPRYAFSIEDDAALRHLSSIDPLYWRVAAFNAEAELIGHSAWRNIVAWHREADVPPTYEGIPEYRPPSH